MADNVEVRLGSDVGPAKSGMEDASRSIQSSLQAIQKSLDTFGSTNKRTTEEAIKNNADLSRTFLELKASATGGFDGIIGVIERFKGVWLSLAGLLAGGALWKSSVDEMLRFEEEVRKIQIVFGMMSDQATTTAISLKILGKSGDDFAAMGMKLARQIKMDEQGIKDLGVQTRDTATGALLPLDVIMQNGFKTMQDYRAGADQDIVALKLFGRGVGDVVETMIRLPAAQQRAIELQKELGITMDPAHQAEIEGYRLELGAFQVILGSIGERIGAAVLPQLMNLARYFNDVGPSAAEFIVNAIKLVVATIDAMATGAKEDYLIVRNAWENITIAAVALWDGIKAAFTIGGPTVAQIWEKMNARILANTLKTNAEVLGLEHDLILRIAALNEKRTSAPGAIPGFKSGGRSAPTGKGGGAESDVSGFEASLKASENYYNNLKLNQGSFEVWSEEMTRDYWAQVLNFANLSEKDREAITNKFYDAERKVQQRSFAAYIASLEADKAALGHNIDAKIAIEEKEYALIVQRYGTESPEAESAYKKLVDLRQQLADQRNRIADAEAKMDEARAKHTYDMAKLSADQQLALRQINTQQRLAIEQKYLDDEYAIELAAVNKRIALMQADPNSNPEELARLEAQKLKIVQDYETKATQIANQAELDRMQYVLQAEQAVQNTFATMLTDLMDRTKSWKQVMLDAVNSITKALNDLVAKKLAEQIFGAGTGGNSILGSLFSGLFGAGASPAGGGGFSIPAFDVGTPYVPRDTLALVHRGEAIIPAAQNRGRAGGSPLSVTNHFHIVGPVDSRTQDQIAAASARATQRALYRTL